jgi:CRP/FNR family transcriptional regulator, cyclic AMP receptor protein
MDTQVVSGDRAAELLANTRLLRGLDKSSIARLAEKAIERTYGKGQLLFYQGDPGEALFVMVEGLVKVFVTSEDGEEMVLVTVQPGDVFGELSLIDGGPRSASAQALEVTKVLVVTRTALLDLLAADVALAEAMLRSVGQSLRRLTEQAADLVFLDLNGRVAKLVVGFAEKQGADDAGEIVLDLHMTQSDIAGMVGGSRQSVNHILKTFERRGYVDLDGRHIRVRELDLLRKRAGM